MYCKFDKYDITTTSTTKKRSGTIDADAKTGTAKATASMEDSAKYSLRDRTAGFNLVQNGVTINHPSDSAACLSVIVVVNGHGCLVINNQQLVRNKNYVMDSEKLYEVHDYRVKDVMCNWVLDTPVDIYDW